MENNHKKIGFIAITVLLISGCSNVLYSNQAAPVYASMASKNGKVDTSAAKTTASIEKSATNKPVIVNNSTNPYATQSAVVRPIESSVGKANTAVVSANNAIEKTEQTTGRLADTLQNKTPSDYATNQNIDNTISASSQAALSEDPRIKSANEVLNNAKSSVSKTQEAMRPTTVANTAKEITNNTVTASQSAATNTTTAMASKATQATNAVTNTASKATTSVTETAKATVAKVIPPSVAKPESATQSLLKEAKLAVVDGDLEKAASSLERAHRIEPSNPKILYDIAQIRYAQEKYAQASSFASKAANLSNSNPLSKKIWTLLSKSRKALGQSSAAVAAAEKAAKF